LQISLFNRSDNSTFFTTKIEINNLELNEDRLSLIVVGTNAMKGKGPPIYYTFELDV
jgi:hypothetical protein